MAETVLISGGTGLLGSIITQFLQKKGYKVLTASNGEEGIQILEREKCDLVITDLLMPEMDGYTFIKEMKESEFGAKIIAISGGDEFVNADDCLKVVSAYGLSAIIKKPVNEDELNEEVEKALL